MTATRPRWYDDPAIADVLDQPVPDVLGEMRARTDAALARLRASEQRIDRQLLDEWLESPAARDYLPTSEE